MSLISIPQRGKLTHTPKENGWTQVTRPPRQAASSRPTHNLALRQKNKKHHHKDKADAPPDARIAEDPIEEWELFLCAGARESPFPLPDSSPSSTIPSPPPLLLSSSSILGQDQKATIDPATNPANAQLQTDLALLNQQYARFRKRWEESDERRALVAEVEAKVQEGLRVDRSVCLGLGSFGGGNGGLGGLGGAGGGGEAMCQFVVWVGLRGVCMCILIWRP